MHIIFYRFPKITIKTCSSFLLIQNVALLCLGYKILKQSLWFVVVIWLNRKTRSMNTIQGFVTNRNNYKYMIELDWTSSFCRLETLQLDHILDKKSHTKHATVPKKLLSLFWTSSISKPFSIQFHFLKPDNWTTSTLDQSLDKDN